MATTEATAYKALTRNFNTPILKFLSTNIGEDVFNADDIIKGISSDLTEISDKLNKIPSIKSFKEALSKVEQGASTIKNSLGSMVRDLKSTIEENMDLDSLTDKGKAALEELTKTSEKELKQIFSNLTAVADIESDTSAAKLVKKLTGLTTNSDNLIPAAMLGKLANISSTTSTIDFDKFLSSIKNETVRETVTVLSSNSVANTAALGNIVSILSSQNASNVGIHLPDIATRVLQNLSLDGFVQNDVVTLSNQAVTLLSALDNAKPSWRGNNANGVYRDDMISLSDDSVRLLESLSDKESISEMDMNTFMKAAVVRA